MATSTLDSRSRISLLWRREMTSYPLALPRVVNLAIVVLVTVVLYFQLYVSSSVTPLLLAQLHMSFLYLVSALAIGNLIGAFGSLLAGLTDRFGRANLIVAGLLIVGLLTLIGMPNVTTKFEFAALYVAIGFFEGIILVTTPALIRDFSPQVGRATAMGFWTMGPVVGSLVVSVVASQTLTVFHTWQSQFTIAGVSGLVVFVIAAVGLRELSPALRDQLMVSERDKALVQARAKGIDVEASIAHPWRQMLHFDVIASAFGVSVMLLIYYTEVAFFTVYVTTIFGFDLAKANELGNWTWATNAIALVLAGMISDKLKVRKPLMVAGGVLGIVVLIVFLARAGHPTSYSTLVLLVSALSVALGFAYVSWMASFTETVEARNPALSGTGLAIWGWIQRLVVTVAFFALPLVINTVTTLVNSPEPLAKAEEITKAGGTPGPALLGQLGDIKQAAADSPGQWQAWYWICVVGIAVFIGLSFVMKGRWSPKAARADQERHDAEIAAALAELQAAKLVTDSGDNAETGG